MTQNLYLVWANHLYTHGIGEVVYTVDASLSSKCALKPTPNVRGNEVNIIVDEFSNPYFVERLARIKQEYPRTRFVFVATEFVTPIVGLGLELGHTFNFFGNLRDWADVLRNTDVALKTTRRLPSYMHRRYLGFVKALPLCDMLAFVHPRIGSGLKRLVDLCGNLIAPPAALYPELTFDFGEQEHLQGLAVGFDFTGTLTKYRLRVMRKLERRFARCGYDRSIWRHVKFDESEPIEFSRSAIRFNYDIRAHDPPANHQRFLFNINPPQRARWHYSSPMRIARAALLGQIPAVTAKFEDHEIEDIAYLWDGTLQGAQQVLSFGIDRGPLLERYRRSVQRYNAEAKAKNRRFIETIDVLLRKSA